MYGCETLCAILLYRLFTARKFKIIMLELKESQQNVVQFRKKRFNLFRNHCIDGKHFVHTT